LPSQIESMAKIKKQILMKKSLCGLFIWNPCTYFFLKKWKKMFGSSDMPCGCLPSFYHHFTHQLKDWKHITSHQVEVPSCHFPSLTFMSFSYSEVEKCLRIFSILII
jgi:hypothetical protein